ncbi:MAG: PTS IIA-like nitrogen regulatory protein PtsN [Caulobacteraceae bacterium]
MDIGDLLDRQAIIPRVTAGSKRQALSVAAEVAARLYRLKSGEVLDALLAREDEGSTGVGSGVAVPHARLKGLDRIHGVFLRLETPIDFDSVDDQPVDLLFVLLAPLQARTEHLRALAYVSRALRRPDMRQHLRQARTQDALMAFLAREATPSAA